MFGQQDKPLPGQKVWAPHKGPQHAFFISPAFELLYGGAAGGGKTDALIVYLLSQTHIPNYKGILFRRTFPELEKSVVPKLFTYLQGKAKPRNRGTEWHFANGAILYLSHLEHEYDKEKHKSAEYDVICFDELTSFSESQYLYLFSRCRGTNPDIQRSVRSATNPSGTGLQWVKKRFIDLPNENTTPKWLVEYDYAAGWQTNGVVYNDFSSLPDNFHEGEPYFTTENYTVYKDVHSGLTRGFLPALMWANPALLKADPQYVKRLMALPEKEQRALLYGYWDVFEGQFFPNFDPLKNVTPTFSPPAHWRRFVGIDYGFSAPCAILWGAMEPNTNRLFIYREFYAAKVHTTDQALTIQELSKDERIEWYTGDPSMFAKSGMGESHADIYRRSGIPLMPSSNARIPGWALMREMMDKGNLVITENCPNLLRTIPLMQHAKRNQEDLDTTQEDHALDALRYLILTLRGYNSPQENVVSSEQPPSWWQTIKKNQNAHTFTSPAKI